MEKQPRENKKEIVIIYSSEKDNKIFEIAIVLEETRARTEKLSSC
jgi:hypothetical protein